MPWSSPTHLIPLIQPPSILRMSGRRVHGLRGTERYRLDRFWCLNLFEGEGELAIADQVLPFRTGYAGITWPGENLVYRFKAKTVKTWVHFIPQEDGRAVDIPVMQDLGAEFERVRAELQMISSLYRAQPERAVARLWDILWHLVPMQAADPSAEPLKHPLVARAMDEIDMHIAETIEVEALAGELCVSQTHLNRLFKAAIGMTVGNYLRHRRMEAAGHLLMHTTMPIKEIGGQVGLPDPQHFNKAIRGHFGQSPRALRRTTSL